MKALVLSGGGSHCAFQVGAIRALADAGEAYQVFIGTSGGGINAAHCAQREDIEPMISAGYEAARRVMA